MKNLIKVIMHDITNRGMMIILDISYKLKAIEELGEIFKERLTETKKTTIELDSMAPMLSITES
jgi:hypothetical protein